MKELILINGIIDLASGYAGCIAITALAYKAIKEYKGGD